jgi:hypothetical protein
MAPGHLRRVTAALSILPLTTIAACNTPASSGSGASCAGPASPSAYLAWAQVAFVGVMLPGPTVPAGPGDVLLSPARIRVDRYLKGGGPRIVTVVTGVSKSGDEVTGASEGIMPLAGQRWRIYAMTKTMPYDTSVCSGSAPETPNS